ncbi:bifunctional diaminohydroxyphosphoribosylaminopyrimidine deaminase/5-amino-6-(5-phosphoribosylamino)uracil reductase RibD [Thermobaculum terrenum]|nr:bifunctional diaminohydroxyphosphoribosylaminopyrimidine deaminase/5-amino-6-(5-phosphoribosylamino)uracil reductase RibD [Thermobaculum terrenum]
MQEKLATTSTHEEAMRRALELAESALGRTWPNPAVGAVVVRDGLVIGKGATQPPGGPHAEVVALAEAGEAARGAILYVTLEPCSHWGRTPPCTEAIIRAGVREVHAATLDPNPKVHGRGVAQLREAGIEVHLGLCEREATRINEGFFKRVRTGLPFVTLKYAMTLDGRIATRTGSSKWITGEEARTCAHRLRDRADAIMVGVGTVLADDPLLTTRLPPELCGYGGPHHPLRVVVDSRGRTPARAAMLRRDTPGRTLVACTTLAPEDRRLAWQDAGAEVAVFAPEDGRVPLEALLRYLGDTGVNTALVEGGGTLHGALLDVGLADKIVAFVAPKLIGGEGAPAPVGGRGVADMASALELADVRVTQVGRDLLIEGYLRI